MSGVQTGFPALLIHTASQRDERSKHRCSKDNATVHAKSPALVTAQRGSLAIVALLPQFREGNCCGNITSNIFMSDKRSGARVSC